ncbi:helix-turn-helix domain-containing protein [Micromonospora sp. NPDC049274]|uniref:helix-turn-helix domain-containing protein n=1 Tax=Micromonospora sp. NPDC049274 TaxID=3154829 RepID=UPI00341504A8
MESVLSLVPRQRSTTGDAAQSNRLVRAADSRAVYTVAEVAGLLSLSLGSTYALVREGEIPARKLGGRWVIPKGRFHSWLDGTDAEECA